MNNKSKIIIASILIIIVLFIVWVVFYAIDSSKSIVTIETSPKVTNISIGDKLYEGQSSGNAYKFNGTKTKITISREGFKDYSITFEYKNEDVEDGNTIYAPLDPITKEAEDLVMSTEESSHREAITNNSYVNLMDEMNDKYPILSILPHYGRYYTISQGTSRENSDDPEKFALYIDLYDEFEERGRADALEFLKSKGYKPDDYEIIYSVEKYEVRSDD